MSAFTWPVRFVSQLNKLSPTRVTLRSKNYVLWWSKGELRCALDECPHRGARLSCGTVRDDALVCNYHNWSFDGSGACANIPQMPAGSKYPRACNLRTVPASVSDGIVWLSPDGAEGAIGTPTNLLSSLGRFDIATEMFMRLNNSYQLQVENALDVSHLHVVHDGFQGDIARISPVHCTNFYEANDVMLFYFEHESNTPDMEIIFLKPGTVVVRVLHKVTKALFRTNIINVAPETDTTCTILFRDVAPYEGIVFDPYVYGFINRFVINAIFKQDNDVLSNQQANRPTGYEPLYCMPATADKAVATFRRWVRTQGIR